MSLDADARPAAARDAVQRTERDAAARERRNVWVGMEQGTVMGLELLVAICFWAAAGWLVDRWLGTAPWFLAIGALVGNAAGIYLIWLRSARMEAADRSRAGSDARGR